MPFQRQVDEEVVGQICLRYQGGEGTGEIATSLRLHPTTVHYWLVKRGVPRRSISEAKRRYGLRGDAFAAIPDEATAYWLGFLFADGTVMVHRGGKEKSVRLRLHCGDRGHLERFGQFLGTDAPIRATRSGTCELSAYSQRLVDDLIRWGCGPNKSAAIVLRFPLIPGDLHRHFIRGVVDGDGSLFISGETPNISVRGNPAFLSTIGDLILWRTGISGTIREHAVSRAVEYLVYRGLERAGAVGAWLYEDATICLPRKLDRFLSFPIGKHAGTVRHVSEAAVRRYIESQTGK